MLVLVVLAFLALLAARVDAAPGGASALAPLGDDDDDRGTAAGDPVAPPGGGDGDDVSSAHGPPDALVDPALAAALADRAPSLRAATAAAYRVAGLERDPSPGFARRARLAALVPWIGARIGQDDTWTDVPDPIIKHMLVYDVRATWHFDRLVFDPNEIRASGIGVTLRRDRRRLALLVSRTYFAWLRAAVAAARAPVWALRADEAAAELAALTDGAWPARPDR